MTRRKKESTKIFLPESAKPDKEATPQSLSAAIAALKPKTWKDYPRTKDKLAIIGFAPATRHLAPYDDLDYEIWGLNEEYKFDWLKRFDRWFQIHPKWDVMRSNNMNDRNHPHWLSNTSGDCLRCAGKGNWETKTKNKEGVEELFIHICPDCNGSGTYRPPEYRSSLPIYMQEHWDDIPNSIAYPLEESMALLPATLHQRDYFTSSAALMLSLAFLMGYKRVEFYGFEMGTTTEYHYQRSGFEYLVGLFSAQGMEIYVPLESTLLRGELYGFKNMKTGFRQNLEMRNAILDSQEKKAQKDVDIHTGKIQQLQSLATELQSEKMQSRVEDSMREYQVIIGRHNVVKGAQAEVRNLISLYDSYFLAGSEEGAITNGEKVQEFVNLEYKSG